MRCSGATGAGKSSLVHLIPRFYDVTGGRVTIDGVDVREVDEAALHRAIGVALQESVLFSGTIRDNIRYGRPDASDEEVIAAAQMAQAHDFIAGFPDGYDTRGRPARREPVWRAEAAHRHRPRVADPARRC